MRRAALVLALLLGGCFPTIPDGVVACDTVADCPDDTWSCVAGRCTRGGVADAGGRDGGPRDGGSTDGGSMDGGRPDGGPIDGGATDAGPPASCGGGLLFSVSFDGDSYDDACGATAQLFGSPAFVDGPAGRAVRITAGTRIDYPDAALTPTTAMTFAMWVRVLSDGDRCALGLTDTGPEPSSFFFCPYLTSGASSTGPVLFLPTGTGCTEAVGTAAPTDRVTLNEWRHVAVTWDGTIAKSYVDGRERTSGGVSGMTCGADLGVTLGAEDDDAGAIGFPFDGELDEVRIYDRVISEEELCALALGDFSSGSCLPP